MEWLKRILDKSRPLSDFAGEAAERDTCAIGEARSVSLTVGIPGLKDRAEEARGAPKDGELQRFGLAFWAAVSKDQRSAALKHYLAIQRRLATLARVKP